MRSHFVNTSFKIKLLVTLVLLLLGVLAASAQVTVSLTASPQSTMLPDGNIVPMWGWTCANNLTLSTTATTAVTGGGTCGTLAGVPQAGGSVWQPPLITVPYSGTATSLTITLTNNLSFATSTAVPPATAPTTVPTSLVVVGQLGGGLGTTPTLVPSPTHATQGATWPIAGDTGGATFNPPPQGNRVQSFANEVTVGGTPATLVWSGLKPGTYLLESGTHPSIQGPMGLYGVLVVTTPPSTAGPGTAYTGVSYNADVPFMFSEIDPVLNNGINSAVATAGFTETSVRVLRDSVSSVTVNTDNAGNPIAGSGYVLNEPVVINGGGFSVQATAHVSQLVGVNTLGLSPTGIAAITIDNPGKGYTSVPTSVNVTGAGSGAQLTANLSLQGVICSDGATACYPPAVNYTPLYYLVNGLAFNKTAASASLFASNPPLGVTGNVLVRIVNAGLRMHIPSIVGAQTGAASGFSLIAEDGNPLPGVPRVQSEVFMAAGKTYDVMITAPAACTPVPPATTCTNTALPIFDRQLSLSANATARDAGMLAYININGATLPSAAAIGSAVANADTYNSVIAGQTLTVSDPGKGVIANDINVYGVKVVGAVPTGLTLNLDGTFVYTGGTPTTFTYCGNGAITGPACALVALGAAPMEAAGGITCTAPPTYMSKVATTLSIKPPGILAFCKDAAGYPLTVNAASITPGSGLTLTVDPNGGFNASVTAAGSYTFTFKPQNSQNTVAASATTVSLNFPAASGLQVTVYDPITKAPITDYRWVIEEDRTFYVDPTKTTNNGGTAIVPTFGTNFHTSYMPLIATGCTGSLSCESGQTVGGVPAVCDVGNGVCRTDATQQTIVLPGQVALDPTKRYYISVLPGDAANPFNNAYGGAPVCSKDALGNIDTTSGTCGHGMGGAPIAALCPLGTASCTGTYPPVTILTQPAPFPPSKLSVFVFEDDFPLNGEQDGGGGIDVLSPNEPGLGGFNITLFDDAGGTGDATGQMTYDMFNMPLSNSLAGTIDPASGLDACPIGASNLTRAGSGALVAQETTGANGVQGNLGITGTIVTCPKYEADGQTLSPLAGQAVVANLMPGRYGVVATPAADRIGRGEEWLQTNTLDGQKAHDSFLRIGEPSFFQEFGPAGYHVSIGFANPAIINARKPYVCDQTDPFITGKNCTNSITGVATTERMSRTPDERLYSSGDNSSFSFTQCYVSFGDADGEDFAFTKCNADGSFTLSGLPDGDWRVTIFDQWNDMLVDGLSTPVRLAGGTVLNLGPVAVNQWQSNIYTKTFLDKNGNGIKDSDEDGLTLVATNNRFRDGSYSNFNNTDLAGNAGFNEIFPLFSWYVIETYDTRYKSTGTHVVYDAGGPADGTCTSTTAPCGSSGIGGNLANTAEQISVPAALRVPGAVYCADADCSAQNLLNSTTTTSPGGSTGRIDPPTWFGSEGWQGFSGQNNFVEFGKKPYAPGETGGIHGEVIYASTRPFDDPSLLIHTSWTPDVPGVTVNLYKEGTAPDGSTSLTLIDTTKTSSWDDWAQGFRSDGNPNMNCPGQGRDTGTAADLFFFTIYDQPMWLDVYANGGTPVHTIPNNSQFKCFDGMHNWNQVQPAPYDGYYTFPSVTAIDPVTGQWTGTNCTGCVTNPDKSDTFRFGKPMLPPGKYVVEMIVPPGYELVKEEDKNILIGDNYIAPVTQQFAGLGNIFILPDQAEINALYNANNPQNPTNTLGRTTLPSHEGDTGSVESFWPCVGASRVVPDFISLFPQSGEVSPFAGATRNLCDRKEVNLTEQSGALAKFWIFTSAHVAAHFTGVITDDYTSEFDPFSPQFGEKFSPPNLPVSIKDWAGNEVSRIYADQWGTYNGLTYSTWEVNPPNPTGYAPTMMVVCMNDPGPIPNPANPAQMITDPLFNPQYSQFCYEIPFMPGQTQYMDTPVVPVSAFAGAGYNNPDCAYPDLTPAISEVDGDGMGPWVASAGNTLTIHALGDQTVPNNAYSGPSFTTAPFNQKYITRHYGFGATAGTVTIGVDANGNPVPATITSWSDSTIVVQAPSVGGSSGVRQCSIQQQTQYMSGVPANQRTTYCGQLTVTASNGKQSIDAVTVTIAGKPPVYVQGNAPLLASGVGSIQKAIDGAQPGDLIMVPPGTYNEMILMWKPVRLQGVGAATSIINANTQPAGKMNTWRTNVDCLFGLAPAGTPNGYNSSCGTGWIDFNPTTTNPQVDRLPLEATVGWDATLNGNLAELLQEPTLMGALEGAAITVLSKGVVFPVGSNPFAADTFPTGTLLLQNVPGVSKDHCTDNPNPFPSNFACNPSSIDALGITDSSQGGGGIFVHAWGHNLQIANNRINSNAGTLSGGINVGQGEFPGAYFGGTGAVNADPGSCQVSNVTNLQLPYCFDVNLNVHNNMITSNSSTGDELFSATPAGAGGISFCTGTDYYKFNNNWLCGNLSSGDGGGFGQLGFVYHGDIEHNNILFNQSTNPTIPTNGGGILIMGAPDVDPACGATTDQDCLNPTAVGPSDGTGPGLVINANLIKGNAAESGSGGGLRLQAINGSEVVNFPTTPARWNDVTVTNNVIVNNVAGWDGAGISLVDALSVNIINNTVESNDTTASSGVLFNTIGAPLASSQGPCPVQRNPDGTCPVALTTSTPQPAGLVTIQNSSNLTQALPATITCPAGHGPGGTGTGGLTNGACRTVSYPELYNDVFYDNRTFYIGVGPLGPGTTNQQNVVSLFNGFTTTPAASQTATGACPAANYWDIGVRGDTGPTDHSSGVTLTPEASLLTSTTGYAGGGSGFRINTTAASASQLVVSQYCNGARVPPEAGGLGYQVPPGISDATVPNPIFSLTPAATVDEGNNWINISWGPLAETNPVTGAVLGNYAPASNASPVVNYITPALSATTYAAAPLTDFFGKLRKTNNAVDIGAIEFQGAALAVPVLASINPATHTRGSSFTATLTGTALTGANAIAVSGGGVTVTNIAVVNDTTVTATFTITATSAQTARNVTVTTPGGTSNAVTFTIVAPVLGNVTPNSGLRGTAVPVTIAGSGFSAATGVTVSGTGVTVSNFTVVSDTQITATFNITTTATLGAGHNVQVVVAGGNTGTLPFTVLGPTLSSIAPATGARGTAVPVTLTGTHLSTATGVTVSGTGVTVSNFAVVNDTTVTATLTVASTATLSGRNVSVTITGGAVSNNVTFTVQGPTLTSISPASHTRGGTAFQVTLTGTNLLGSTGLTVSGAGITVSNFTVVNATTITANFTIAGTAGQTARTVRVNSPNATGGTTNPVTFTVQ